LADKLNKTLLAAIQEEHTASGSHRVVATPLAQWVSEETLEAADRLSEQEAWSALGDELVGLLASKKSRVKRKP
jgi:hypothetical protein